MNNKKWLLIGMVMLMTLVVAGIRFLPLSAERPRRVGETLRAGDKLATLMLVKRGYNAWEEESEWGLDLYLQTPGELERKEVITLIDKGDEFELRQRAKMITYDGRILWVMANGIEAIEVKSGARARQADLTRVNPELENLWPPDVQFWTKDEAGRMKVKLLDAREVVIDPESMRATEVVAAEKKEQSYAESQRAWANYNAQMAMYGVGPGKFFWHGDRVSGEEWVGLLTAAQVREMNVPGKYWRDPYRATGQAVRRALWRAKLSERVDHKGVSETRLVGMERLAEGEFLDGALLRDAKEPRAMRLKDPDGWLLLHRTVVGEEGRLILTRIDQTGKPLWSKDSGQTKIDQVIPMESYVVLVADGLLMESVRMTDGEIQVHAF